MTSGGDNPSVKRVFYRDILNSLEIPDHLKEAFRELRPLTPEETATWQQTTDQLVSCGTDGECAALAQLNELIGPLSSSFSSLIIWEKFQFPREGRMLIAADVRGVPVIANRRLPVSRFAEVLDLSQNDYILRRGNERYTTIEHHGYYWMILTKGTDETEGVLSIDDDNTITPFIPHELRSELLTAPEKDTALLLRSVLEELGFYNTTAQYIQKIRVVGVNPEDHASEAVFSGYRAKIPSPDENWIPLYETVRSMEKPEVSFARFNQAIPPTVAHTALGNLKTLVETLKRVGIAMGNWSNTYVHRVTGEISLAEGNEPILVDAASLSRALERPLIEILASASTNRDRSYFPNLAAIALGKGKLNTAEMELIHIFSFLQAVSGRLPSASNHDVVAQLAGEEFHRLVANSHDATLQDRIKENELSVHRIIQEYLDNFSPDLEGANYKGIVYFLTDVLPAIMILKSDASEWFPIISQYIEEAKEAYAQDEKMDLNRHWVNLSKPLWTAIRQMRILLKTDGNGQGGSSPQDLPGGGNDILNDPSGGTIPQAKPAQIGGFIDAAELTDTAAAPSSSAEMAGFYNANAAPAAPATDVMQAPIGWVVNQAAAINMANTYAMQNIAIQGGMGVWNGMLVNARPMIH